MADTSAFDPAAVKSAAITLLGWTEAAVNGADMQPIAGGATGDTFLLKPAAAGAAEAVKPVVVRNLRTGRAPWVAGFDLLAVSNAIAAAGIGAAVVASSSDVICYELCRRNSS